MAAETVTDRLIRIKRAIADADRARERALGELRASVTALLEALGDKTPVDSVLEDPAALDAFVKRAETEAGAARVFDLFRTGDNPSPSILIDRGYQLWIDGITWSGNASS
jgi:hypothetical protein